MNKYLYLEEPGWCCAWVNGGKIPIKPASTYLSSSREGTKTPDENLIHNSYVDMASLPRSHGITVGKNVRNLSIISVICNGKLQPDVLNADYYKDDGLILSFCNIKSNDVCRKLKKKACVEIYSIDILKLVIDEQLGIESIAKNCCYTNDHRRDHFLKSTNDGWQKEYRLFWPINDLKVRWVDLPAKLARKIKIRL